MATITGLTAARMLAIEAASVVDGEVVGDDLILTRHDGSNINAGDVRGPQGLTGATGSDVSAISAQPVLDVGMLNQIRAGRNLATSDFTDMGLSAPIGLYPLSGTPDTSGNGRNLTNKGSVGFTTKGIMGAASSAATFIGSSAQALYVADSGAADPFRIRTGTIGCWFRAARKLAGDYKVLISKTTYPSDGQMNYWLEVGPDGRLAFNITPNGNVASKAVAQGQIDYADDRWHFAVATHDGSRARLYVDGHLEAFAQMAGLIFAGSGPFNIGASGANAGLGGSLHYAGAIDEAFITSDVLSDDQIRNLYCARIAHGRPSTPTRIGVGVRRLKKGAALVSGDFPTQPVRLYNFSGGALTDAGSNGQTLTANTSPVVTAGADGLVGNAYNFVSTAVQSLSSTDTGLPSGTTSRSYGAWFKTLQATSSAIVSWGGAGTSAQAIWVNGAGIVVARSISDDLTGLFVADGNWHFVVVTEENAPADSNTKRKIYVDGKCIAISITMNSITLGGANRFRIAHWPDGSGGGLDSFTGQIDSVFVCNYVLAPDAVAALYAKGSQPLAASTKNPGDHIEVVNSSSVLAVFDTLGSQDQVDLVVN